MSDAKLVPQVNKQAWLSLNGDLGTLYPSRIESVSDGNVTISPPLTNKGNSMIVSVEVPSTETKCALLWNQNDSAYWKQECYLNEVEINGTTTWQLKLVGEPREVQRRGFTRVPEDMQAQLHLSDRTVDAQVNDISEGGFNCTLKSFKIGPEHLYIYVDLVIAQHQVLIPSQLVHVEDKSDGTMEIGIQFMQIENVHADLIRQHVFSRQIDMYNNGEQNER